MKGGPRPEECVSFSIGTDPMRHTKNNVQRTEADLLLADVARSEVDEREMARSPGVQRVGAFFVIATSSLDLPSARHLELERWTSPAVGTLAWRSSRTWKRFKPHLANKA